MGLAELFEQRFRSDIRFRGEAYFRSERVAVVKVTPDDLHAEVRDGVMHHTRLQRHEGQLKFICSCTPPGTNGQQAYCKHVWATLLSVDEGNYLQGTPKPGFIPPFLTQSSSLDLPPSAVEREDSSPATKLHPTSRTATGSPRLWEDILRQMRSALTDQDTTPIPGNREREIYYEIDLRASDDEGMLILQTSQRQRRNNGEWGKLKPLKLRPGKFDEIDDPEDRRILAYLMGATPERGTSSGGMGETWAAVHRYRVPHDLCLLLLPTIAATGRLRIADEDERVTEVLRWDPADPWELTLTVQYAAETKLWKLSGWLVRGDERLSLQQPQLLLPGGLVLHQHTIARLRDYEAFTWARLLRQHVSLEVPQGEEHDLVDRLLDMPVLPRLELPQELQLEQVRIAPTPLITLEAPTKQRWHRERLRATVEFEYDGWRVRGSTFQWAIVDRLQQRCILRDDQRENELWAQLEQAGFRRLLDQRHSQHDVEIVIRDLGFAVRKLIQQGWVVRAADKQVRQPLHLQFRVKSAIDWFELHAHLEFDGASASLPELLAALRRGDGTIRLDDGSWGILPEEWLAQFGLLAQLGQLDEDHLKFSTVQAGLLDALLSTLPGVNYDARYRQARQMLGHATSVEPLQEPDSFQGTLRPYQRYGVGWLQFLQTARFGGCLADDMGLGKTIQLLAYFEHRRRLGQIRGPSLIVVPKSLLFNWRQECERFTPQLRVLEYTGLDRATLREQFSQHHIVLTTYGTLRRDILVLKDQRFDYVVLDEAQAIKNPGSQIAKAVRLLQAEHRLALTGTPIENHLGDLCSIFEFLNPGMLGRSTAARLTADNPQDSQFRSILAEGLRPLILRRTKAAVAHELPEKSKQTIVCQMGPEQERLYQELRDHYRISLLGLIEEQGLGKSKMHVLEALLRLRQAACHPGLLKPELVHEPSAKLETLCSQLEQLLEEGHKALVFSQFTSMLAIVRHHFDQLGIVYEYLDGQTRDRKERVTRFQNDPQCSVFLISLKAGGLGLNLTAADYVFILDPWWNPAVEEQAIDRAHRVGQKRHVFAYRLICKDTVEEKILQLQQHKEELAAEILKPDETLMRTLTLEDIEKLLS